MKNPLIKPVVDGYRKRFDVGEPDKGEVCKKSFECENCLYYYECEGIKDD